MNSHFLTIDIPRAHNGAEQILLTHNRLLFQRWHRQQDRIRLILEVARKPTWSWAKGTIWLPMRQRRGSSWQKRWDEPLWRNSKILTLYLDRVDCAIQVSLGDGCNDEEVALDRKGEIKHHEGIAKYWNFYLDKVDYAIQVSLGDELSSESRKKVSNDFTVKTVT